MCLWWVACFLQSNILFILCPCHFKFLRPHCPTMPSKLPSPTFAFKSSIMRITSSSLHCSFAAVISPWNLSISFSVLAFVGACTCIMLMLNILPHSLTNVTLSGIAQLHMIYLDMVCDTYAHSPFSCALLLGILANFLLFYTSYSRPSDYSYA